MTTATITAAALTTTIITVTTTITVMNIVVVVITTATVTVTITPRVAAKLTITDTKVTPKVGVKAETRQVEPAGAVGAARAAARIHTGPDTTTTPPPNIRTYHRIPQKYRYRPPAQQHRHPSLQGAFQQQRPQTSSQNTTKLSPAAAAVTRRPQTTTQSHPPLLPTRGDLSNSSTSTITTTSIQVISSPATTNGITVARQQAHPAISCRTHRRTARTHSLRSSVLRRHLCR